MSGFLLFRFCPFLFVDRIPFETAVELCLERDPRYTREAYFFVRDALDHTSKALGKFGTAGPDRHVRGQELSAGLRDYAINEFGPLARTVLAQWGLTKTDDIGEIVFGLIEAGAFSRSEDDSMEDFVDVFEFGESLDMPFLPRSAVPRRVSV
jgi:uncharacterized repeat protein (TIGR04138 family)